MFIFRYTGCWRFLEKLHLPVFLKELLFKNWWYRRSPIISRPHLQQHLIYLLFDDILFLINCCIPYNSSASDCSIGIWLAEIRFVRKHGGGIRSGGGRYKTLITTLLLINFFKRWIFSKCWRVSLLCPIQKCIEIVRQTWANLIKGKTVSLCLWWIRARRSSPCLH